MLSTAISSNRKNNTAFLLQQSGSPSKRAAHKTLSYSMNTFHRSVYRMGKIQAALISFEDLLSSVLPLSLKAIQNSENPARSTTYKAKPPTRRRNIGWDYLYHQEVQFSLIQCQHSCNSYVPEINIFKMYFFTSDSEH